VLSDIAGSVARGSTYNACRPFVHALPSNRKSRRERPTGFHLEEEMRGSHFYFLVPIGLAPATILPIIGSPHGAISDRTGLGADRLPPDPAVSFRGTVATT
jgi:hypothetical protein